MSKLSEKIKYPTSEFKYWKWDDDFQKELIALEVENQKLKETRNRHHPEMLKLTEERDRYKAQTKKAEDEVKTLNEAWDKQNVELCTTINIQKLEIIKLKERLAKAQDIAKRIRNRQRNSNLHDVWVTAKDFKELEKTLGGDE